jgi:hypothetical protein
MYISSRFKILLTFYFFVCTAIFVLCTAHWKQVNDPAQISYLCFLMDHGMAPYRDLLEINLPGIYLVNWSIMHTLGEGAWAWRVFDFSLMGVASWAMIVIARPYDWLAGVLGATLFVLYHGRDGAGQAGQRDFIIAVLLLCAYALLFEFLRRRRGEWTLFAFGLCAGVATTIKPTPLPFVLLLLAWAAFRWKRMGEPVLRRSLYALAGLLVPFVIVGAFLVSKDSVSSFWYLLHVELPFYKSLGRLPFFKLMSLLASSSVFALALIGLAVALLRSPRWNWEYKLLLAGIAFGVASFLGQGKGFPYHRYPMLAFLFLWLAIEIVTGIQARGPVRNLAAIGLAFVLILLPLYVREASRRVWDLQFIDSLANDLNHLGGRELSGHVQCIYMPAGCDTALYRLRLVQSTGLFYDYLIFGSPQQRVIRDQREQFWQQFRKNTPRVVIVGSGLYPDGFGYGKLASWPLFQQELARNYVLYDDRWFPPDETGQRAYRIYVEKNIQLASNQH